MNVGRLGVENFANGAHGVFPEMRFERSQETVCLFEIIGMQFEPSIDERTDEPGPNRALVVSGVAVAEIAVVFGLEVAFARTEGPKTKRCEQFGLHAFHDWRPLLFVEYREIERDGKDLIGAKLRIVTVFAVDDVVEIAAALVPEAFLEGTAATVGVLLHFSGLVFVTRLIEPGFQEAKRVIPERVDLHRLPAARGDDPVANFGIHPRELVTFGALTQQTVGGIDANAEVGALQMVFGNFDELRQNLRKKKLIVAERKIAGQGVKEPQ